MDNLISEANATCLESELEWFQTLWLLRGKITFELSEQESALDQLAIPSYPPESSNYAKLIAENEMTMEERLVLLLALIPHIKPAQLDILQIKNQNFDLPFTEFGGVKGEKHRGLLPTGETIMFLLAGTGLNKRFRLQSMFEKDHFFFRKNILFIDPPNPGEPFLSGTLRISKEYLTYLTTGGTYTPNFDQEFPACKVETEQEWSDLIVNESVMEGVIEIKNWLEHGYKLKSAFDFGRRIKPGFKVLFTGPPGTGKTLTASLLGKSCQMDVYRVDLSMVVSKYIGETEKNLSKVFDLAENKNWILFFDEADSLFGKRSQTSDSHDRYANQEVSFLLQRIEDYRGLVILCTNFKNNIDEAFFRRFQLVLDFELPDFSQRLHLWNTALGNEFEYEPAIDLERVAEIYELSAASIINVLHFCLLKCMARKSSVILQHDLKNGIKIEKIKEGKSLIA